MGRVFVYANKYDPHITVHCESNGPCHQILKNSLGLSCTIVDISPCNNKEILKLDFGRSNYAWYIVWVPPCIKDVAKYLESMCIAQVIRDDIGLNPSVRIQTCSYCC